MTASSTRGATMKMRKRNKTMGTVPLVAAHMGRGVRPAVAPAYRRPRGPR